MRRTTEPTAAEAIAAYAAGRNLNAEQPFYVGHILILDLDSWSASLCECSDKCRIRELASRSIKENIPVIAQNISGTPYTLRTLLGMDTSLLAEMNRSFHIWLRMDGAAERNACTWQGQEVSCSAVYAAYQKGIAPATAELCRLASQILRQQDVEEDHVQIIIAGSLARFYPAQHSLREHFCYDPFLEDERFRPLEDDENPAAFYEKGMEIWRSGRLDMQTEIGHDIGLKLAQYVPTKGITKFVIISLAAAGQVTEELEHPVFTAPIGLCHGESVIVVTDDREQAFAVPETLFPENTKYITVRACICIREDQLCLLLQNSNMPDRQDTIVLSVAVGKEK